MPPALKSFFWLTCLFLLWFTLRVLVKDRVLTWLYFCVSRLEPLSLPVTSAVAISWAWQGQEQPRELQLQHLSHM
jgi:hypothetical protein